MPLPTGVYSLARVNAQGGIAFWALNTAGFEGEVYARNPHDTVFLGGLQLPGVCKVKALPNQQIDRQKVPGKAGATMIWKGYIPGPVDIECVIWTPDQWDTMQEVIKQVWQKAGKELAGKGGSSGSKKKGGPTTAELQRQADIAEQTALPIIHPGLQLLGITRVVVAGISLPEEGSIPQARTVSFKCLEFVPTGKRDVTGKVNGSASVPFQRAGETVGTGPLTSVPPPSQTLKNPGYIVPPEQGAYR